VLLFLLFSTACAPTRSSKELYVSPDGNDKNPGSLSAPFRTIQHAVDLAEPGHTVLLRGGVYNESVEIRDKKCTPAARITVRNYPGEKPIVRGSSSSRADAIVSIKSSTYVVVEGLTIDEVMKVTNVRGDWIAGFHVSGSSNTVKDCRVLGSPARDRSSVRVGISIDGGRGHLVQGNVVRDLHYSETADGKDERYRGFGIHIGAGTEDATLRRNVVTRVDNDAVYIGASSATTAGEVPRSITIEQNRLGESRQEDGIMFDQAYNQDWPITGCVVRGNTIYANGENAIDLKGTDGVEISGNTIYGNKGANDGSSNRGGGCGAIMHGASTKSVNVTIFNNVIYGNMGGIRVENGYKIYNNVIVGNNSDYTGSNSTYDDDRKPYFTGIMMKDAPAIVGGEFSGVEIKNNIIAGHRHGEITLNGAIKGDTVIENNLFWEYRDPRTGQTYRRFVAFRDNYDWSLEGLVTEWRAYSGDRSSVVADPLFMDADSADYRLTGKSPAVDAGSAGGAPEKDKDGHGRFDDPGTSDTGSGPYTYCDIGAYEYRGAPGPQGKGR